MTTNTKKVLRDSDNFNVKLGVMVYIRVLEHFLYVHTHIYIYTESNQKMYTHFREGKLCIYIVILYLFTDK